MEPHAEITLKAHVTGTTQPKTLMETSDHFKKRGETEKPYE